MLITNTINKALWVHIVCPELSWICILCWLQVQAGKGINISARTFHLAQGDILKVRIPVLNIQTISKLSVLPDISFSY